MPERVDARVEVGLPVPRRRVWVEVAGVPVERPRLTDGRYPGRGARPLVRVAVLRSGAPRS